MVSWSLKRFVVPRFRWTRTSGCRCRNRIKVSAKRGTNTILVASHSFHSSRYPTKPSDTARKFDASKHNHVVFVRKNKFFTVPLANADGHELTAAELEAQIEKVIQLAGETAAAPIGALTSENRDTWTDVCPDSILQRFIGVLIEILLTRRIH